jgi:peptide deformylase
MPRLTIVTFPHPILKRKARPVTDFGPALQTLIDDMLDTLRDAPGVGLAAPQVDVPLRLFVAEWGDDEDEDAPKKTYVMVNPEITRYSRETETGTEGCLSIPGILGDVERAWEITISAQNRRGQKIKLKPKGWLARIFQHEFDHLNGDLFTEKAERLWRQGSEPADQPGEPDSPEPDPAGTPPPAA